MDLQIRDFVPEDRENYLNLSRDFYRSKAVDHDVPASYFLATFDACLNKSPYTRGFVFLCSGEIAGYALISLTWSNEVGGLVVLLEEAYIQPEFQGQGMGSTFFDFITEEYPDAKRFRLEVTPSNTSAINLYERRGFEGISYIQMIKDFT